MGHTKGSRGSLEKVLKKQNRPRLEWEEPYGRGFQTEMEFGASRPPVIS